MHQVCSTARDLGAADREFDSGHPDHHVLTLTQHPRFIPTEQRLDLAQSLPLHGLTLQFALHRLALVVGADYGYPRRPQDLDAADLRIDALDGLAPILLSQAAMTCKKDTETTC